MKRTLKRELKVCEIVKRETFEIRLVSSNSSSLIILLMTNQHRYRIEKDRFDSSCLLFMFCFVDNELPTIITLNGFKELLFF